MGELSIQELIDRAESVLKPRLVRDRWFADVAAAIETVDGTGLLHGRPDCELKRDLVARNERYSLAFTDGKTAFVTTVESTASG